MQKIIYIICFLNLHAFAQKIQVSGFVKDKKTGEALIGVAVFCKETGKGTQSNNYGFFSVAVTNSLSFSMLGYKAQTIEPKQNENLIILLEEVENILTEVVISTKLEHESQKIQMSSMSLSPTQIKQMPLIMGEKDPLKALQLLPGVQQGTEGTSTFFVRGGGADQNLILLDEAIVYNANHLFGFFSTFNADPIKRVELFKGGFPARYGGRLSSVVDVQMKEGNNQNFHAEGGIGLIASRLTLEIPLIKNKSSLLVSGRRTYADLLIRPFMPKEATFSYSFFDTNLKWNYIINPKNTIYLSSYFGKDALMSKEIMERTSSTIYTNSGIGWGNTTNTFRWNHIYSNKLFSNVSLIQTSYHFGLEDKYRKATLNGETKSDLSYYSRIKDYALKGDFDYFISSKNTLKFGGIITKHQFIPRDFNYVSSQATESMSQKSNPINNIEAALYAETNTEFSKKLSANIGLRFSFFNTAKKTYIQPEPRVAFAYKTNGSSAIKASYSRMNQFTHLLSNTGGGLPTDLWVPANEQIPFSNSDQIAIGFSKDLPKNYALTIESYYKWLRNIINYKEGASFIAIGNGTNSDNFKWEDNVTSGIGWGYGTELLLQKKAGNFTGWLGYTLSYSIRQFDELNSGKTFYARQDRRHDIEITGSYKISDKIRLSSNLVFNTGSPISIPSNIYFIKNNSYQKAQHYDAYNSFRMAGYHRLDLGIQFYKKKKWGERYWDLSIYNAYFRKNPIFYSVQEKLDTQTEGYTLTLKKNWLLPILPSISYNFKF